jgi:hypothetical protein
MPNFQRLFDLWLRVQVKGTSAFEAEIYVYKINKCNRMLKYNRGNILKQEHPSMKRKC